MIHRRISPFFGWPGSWIWTAWMSGIGRLPYPISIFCKRQSRSMRSPSLLLFHSAFSSQKVRLMELQSLFVLLLVPKRTVYSLIWKVHGSTRAGTRGKWCSAAFLWIGICPSALNSNRLPSPSSTARVTSQLHPSTQKYSAIFFIYLKVHQPWSYLQFW